MSQSFGTSAILTVIKKICDTPFYQQVETPVRDKEGLARFWSCRFYEPFEYFFYQRSRIKTHAFNRIINES
jgi:hypothetical protein